MRKAVSGPRDAPRGWVWGWWLLVAVVAGWLLWMTLRSQASVRSDLAPLISTAQTRGISPRLLIGFLGNIVAFVPLGAAVSQALNRRSPGWRVLWSVLAGAGLSALIELLQGFSPSRVSDWMDWVLNTLGALFGALGVLLVRALWGVITQGERDGKL